jgi:hypothetical protein
LTSHESSRLQPKRHDAYVQCHFHRLLAFNLRIKKTLKISVRKLSESLRTTIVSNGVPHEVGRTEELVIGN